MDNALIRVVVPVFKTETLLERCVNSVLSQTEPRFHLVLVDDGSPDGCPDLCDHFAFQDPRVTVVHQTNRGLSAARNVGLEIEDNCEFITFIDSDDWVAPAYLETMLCAALDTGCSVVVGGHKKIAVPAGKIPLGVDRDQKMDDVFVCSPEECYCLKTVSVTPAWGKLFHADALRSARFPEGRIHEDYFFTWKVVFAEKRIAVVSQPLYAYIINENGIMRSAWSPSQMDFFLAMDEKIAWFRDNRFEMPYRRAAYKAFRTSSKYLRRVQGTEYAGKYAPVLQQLHIKYLDLWKKASEEATGGDFQ